MYIAFVLQYVQCFEKNNACWLNESWETRLPKRLKCTMICCSMHTESVAICAAQNATPPVCRWQYALHTPKASILRRAIMGPELCLFVCLGLTSLWNIWGHITMVPACSSGTLTNVLPHRNAMPQTLDTTPHPVTVYRHGADLSLCYPSMWNVTLEYTATHFNVLGETWPGNPSPTFHTHQRTFNLMLSWWSTVGSSVESTVPTGSWTRDLWCANPVRYPLAHSDFTL